jgi:hypothetical protein
MEGDFFWKSTGIISLNEHVTEYVEDSIAKKAN